MTVWVLTREEQNQHGYVDTSIVAVFRSEQRAIERRTLEEEVARAEGLLVDGDPLTPAGEWQYSLNISMHVVDARAVNDLRAAGNAIVGLRDLRAVAPCPPWFFLAT